MRLLNTQTLQLRDFYTDIPKYAILSHTWGLEEVTFQDIQPGSSEFSLRSKAGWYKVENACAHARRHDFEWIWIDTCCINKDSSAELSEAINSMYQYYEDSVVCYAYLPDVLAGEDPRAIESSFRNSRWFKRGWTLQELLAPPYVVFLDQEWTEIGTKWRLRDVISVITSIPAQVLEDGDVYKFSIAQRMSWAAYRKTTRPEDVAYCLMGIFGVNMPSIYGEGAEKAFMRLQLEIIKISDDRSIFAWVSQFYEEQSGLFARHPFEFRASGEVGIAEAGKMAHKSLYSFGNNGLRIHMHLVPASPSFGDVTGLFLASLHCQSEMDGSWPSIYLRLVEGERYVRYRPDEVILAASPPSIDDMQEIIVKENLSSRRKRARTDFGEVFPVFRIKQSPSTQKRFTLAHSMGTGEYTLNNEIASDCVEVSDLTQNDLVFLKYCLLEQDRNFSLALGIGASGPFYDILSDTDPDESPNLSTMSSLAAEKRNKVQETFMDRVELLLNDGFSVSVSLRLTASDIFELEISCSAGPRSVIPFLPSLLQPQKLSFEVPTYLFDSEQLWRLCEVYPPDFSRKQLNEESTFISMHDISDPSHTFRVLTYKDDKYNFPIQIVLGFHNSTAWTDILVQDVSRKLKKRHLVETPQQIWESYLDSGSRVQRRLVGCFESRSAQAPD
ncbi:hypothetical protein VKT23_008041 [Stygiomarasmius scandens]|uniref:Heterokaryon incompatibility domain-containing protein n=1 Tax=Marasmiellus scandens TaxID=2682957 RepID=A0ABR1JME4_9AGAR